MPVKLFDMTTMNNLRSTFVKNIKLFFDANINTTTFQEPPRQALEILNKIEIAANKKELEIKIDTAQLGELRAYLNRLKETPDVKKTELLDTVLTKFKSIDDPHSSKSAPIEQDGLSQFKSTIWNLEDDCKAIIDGISKKAGPNMSSIYNGIGDNARKKLTQLMNTLLNEAQKAKILINAQTSSGIIPKAGMSEKDANEIKKSLDAIQDQVEKIDNLIPNVSDKKKSGSSIFPAHNAMNVSHRELSEKLGGLCWSCTTGLDESRLKLGIPREKPGNRFNI